MIKKFTSWNDFPGCNINSNSINDRIFRRRKASIKEISGSVDSVIMFPFQLLRIIKLLRLSWINLCLSNINANCIKDRSVVFKILFDVRKKMKLFWGEFRTQSNIYDRTVSAVRHYYQKLHLHFFCMNKICNKNKAQICKKKKQVQNITFWGWEVQKQKIKERWFIFLWKNYLQNNELNTVKVIF